MRPTLEVLDTPLIEGILDDAHTVLETLGILVDHQPAFDRLQAAGLSGDPGTRVSA